MNLHMFFSSSWDSALNLARAMCHNEAKYSNSSEFNPERFLNADGTLTDDTVSVVWGFGRRVCPGRHLAEASLWSAMAGLLAVFKISKAKDENGREIDIQPRWRAGLVVYVLRGRIAYENTDLALKGSSAIPLQYHCAECRTGYDSFAAFG
jgi:hypothetical protein